MRAIGDYERRLSREMILALKRLGAEIYGVGDENSVEKRVPTISFTLAGITPQDFATRMGEAGVGLRDGHLFAPRLMKRLGLSMATGAIRVSLVHYNTIEEIRRFERIAERVIAAACHAPDADSWRRLRCASDADCARRHRRPGGEGHENQSSHFYRARRVGEPFDPDVAGFRRVGPERRGLSDQPAVRDQNLERNLRGF